jgi:AcrR family transcriptional regulator
MTNVASPRRTPLSRALHGAAAPVAPTPLDAYKLAKRAFLALERVDMTTIAERLGIGRVTLYRWVGNRAALLGEVMAELAISTARAERSRIDATGAEAIARVATYLVQTLMSFEPMQHLLRAEPEFALRVLTTAEGSTAARITDYWTQEIDSEIAAGQFSPVLPASDLAYLIVRLSESFVYKDVIAGEPADPALAERVFRMILQSAAG